MNAKDRHEIEEQLSAYIDDELDPQQRAQVEALLAEDAGLRQLLDELRQTAELVQALPAEAAPRALRDSTMALAERELLLGEPERAPRPAVRSRAVVWRRLSAAAVIGLALTAGYFTIQRINHVEPQRVAGTQRPEAEESAEAPQRVAPSARRLRQEAGEKERFARPEAPPAPTDAEPKGKAAPSPAAEPDQAKADEDSQRVASREGAERGALDPMRLLFPQAEEAAGAENEASTFMLKKEVEAQGMADIRAARAAAPAATARMTLQVAEAASQAEAVGAVERFLAQNGIAPSTAAVGGEAGEPALVEGLGAPPALTPGAEAGQRGMERIAAAATREIRFRAPRSQVAALVDSLSIAHPADELTMTLGEKQIAGWRRVAQQVRQIEPAAAVVAQPPARQRGRAILDEAETALPVPLASPTAGTALDASGAKGEPQSAPTAARADGEEANAELRLGLTSQPEAPAAALQAPARGDDRPEAREKAGARDEARRAARADGKDERRETPAAAPPPSSAPTSAPAPAADELAPSPYVNELLRLLGTDDLGQSEPMIDVTLSIRTAVPSAGEGADKPAPASSRPAE